MDEQHEYTVQIGGIDHTLLLTKQQAKERGLSDSARVSAKQDAKPATKAAAAPRNKARSAKDKASAPADDK